ncbi:MAG: acetylornithine transaminase [Hamadaea sp.]|uniref:acetylornithine transaminase n=1 Tax=Hamadaea sp. TaxID=2024425 RepID=UPI0017C5A66F|nr:acetylornithine transaminase [Hamadaea sp.]NUR71171.1 acetylornithine transaminase [Hamadaea sp.]NUT24164.1 acetylornithine transaminase [Hamadaea sp.]
MTSLLDRWQHSLADNYGTPTVGLVSGQGAVLVDEAGKSYVDFLGGIAVNALGHAHPAVVSAVSEQVAKLGHVSNFYAAEPTVALAELLLALTGRPGKVFFCNSGAEANEAAFKMSRLTGRTGIVAAQGAFHGRTMGALSLTGQPGKRDPFTPLPGDVTHVPYGDLAALAAAVDENTAMVILEPIMGEGGVVVAPPGYLAGVREITAERGALFVLDEVQTGVGRTGHWFQCQAEGVAPDIITLAKGLGGGLPLGAAIAFADGEFAESHPGGAAGLFQPGHHGTTFGGNPIACAAGLAVLRTIAADGLLDHVKRVGERLRRGIEALGHPLVDHVRGAGLLLGVQLTAPAGAAVVGLLRDAGFIVNACQPDVLRLAPPLIISAEQVDALLAALPSAFDAAYPGAA